ncbi:UDP-3-O-acylglucosamine N-acyltransferase [Rubripirellula obstinata]|uniref:UDP-3-O-acylglucosamine N-acyltransferase n=1 Tax=Rubripirellula obstinata TaxID=406547 RepID=A0A5B1CFH6_9BACT|nr:UDP-3-O-(3-hydroxymyristoyl)glucosamine N-acyltransferase [Rubripirellula obstinata]KAA1258961.1 UDP-3-O-acylglucosamine N-acyltransferase [Rubripirellula obstinata]
MQLGEIAELVSGELLVGKTENDKPVSFATTDCCGANVPDEALENEITMIDDARKASSLVDCQAIAVITAQEVELPRDDMAQIVVENVHEAFAAIVTVFRPPCLTKVPFVGTDPTANVARSAMVHPSAVISADVTVGERTCIMPGVVIMPGSTIGDDCVLHAGVTIYEHTQIADRVVIHASSVIGAHGFGYRQENGRHVPTSQLGFVAIESDVEIGASVTIDRGTYGSTRVGEGTKIDNQVMIAHNCQIGKHNLICSQVGIAGSSRTGDHVILAGQVGIKDHVTLGDETVVCAQSGVMEDLAGKNVYLGSPATTQRDQMQIMAVERRLPDMRRELKKLTRKVAALTEQINEGTSQLSKHEPCQNDDRSAA